MNEDERFHAIEPFLRDLDEKQRPELNRDNMAELLAHSGGPLLSLICTNNVLLSRRSLTEKIVMYDRLSDHAKEIENVAKKLCPNNYERALIFLYLAMRSHQLEVDKKKEYSDLVTEVSKTVLSFLNEMQTPDEEDKEDEKYVRNPHFFDPSCN